MKKYSIEVLEVLSRIVEGETADKEVATEKVWHMYRKCEIVLDDSDGYKVTGICVKDKKRVNACCFRKKMTTFAELY